MTLIRSYVGDVLRRRRQQHGWSLREVSGAAAVSAGYLSEVERGEKEASSEMLAAICAALDLPVADMLYDVAAAAQSEASRTAAAAVSGERPVRLAPRPSAVSAVAGSVASGVSPAVIADHAHVSAA